MSCFNVSVNSTGRHKKLSWISDIFIYFLNIRKIKRSNESSIHFGWIKIKTVNKSKYAYMAYTKQERIPFQKKRRGFKNKTHAALKQGIKTLFKLRPHYSISLSGRKKRCSVWLQEKKRQILRREMSKHFLNIKTSAAFSCIAEGPHLYSEVYEHEI